MKAHFHYFVGEGSNRNEQNPEIHDLDKLGIWINLETPHQIVTYNSETKISYNSGRDLVIPEGRPYLNICLPVKLNEPNKTPVLFVTAYIGMDKYIGAIDDFDMSNGHDILNHTLALQTELVVNDKNEVHIDFVVRGDELDENGNFLATGYTNIRRDLTLLEKSDKLD